MSASSRELDARDKDGVIDKSFTTKEETASIHSCCSCQVRSIVFTSMDTCMRSAELLVWIRSGYKPCKLWRRGSDPWTPFREVKTTSDIEKVPKAIHYSKMLSSLCNGGRGEREPIAGAADQSNECNIQTTYTRTQQRERLSHMRNAEQAILEAQIWEDLGEIQNLSVVSPSEEAWASW